MEQWEAVLEACPGPPDLRYFAKAIQVAGVVLKEDLALFEIEWILETLLHKPVNLITTVSTKRADDGNEVWLKVIGDAFKLLMNATETLGRSIETHFEDIVKICSLPFDPVTRKQAILCLESVAKRSVLAAVDINKHVASLQESNTCKAPLAVLVGTICEYHPETIDDKNRIWRIYLNLLDVNKNTSTITKSLLHGVLGLLKHFGSDLPTAELNAFYDKLSSNYMHAYRCDDVCLSILKQHSTLFREKILKDASLRHYLWSSMLNSGYSGALIDATISVYRALGDAASLTEIQNICTTELLPQSVSNRTQVRFAALRILSMFKKKFNINVQDSDSNVDVQSIEFELRRGTVTYDVVNAISFCLESKHPNLEQLLKTCYIFYNNIPLARRREILVHGLLNADSELRSAITSFLIAESTNDANSLEKYLQLWTDIFDMKSSTDLIVIEKSRFIFEDFMSNLIFVLETFLDENIEKPQEKLLTLLNLTSHILSVQLSEEYSKEYCLVLLPLLVDVFALSPEAAVVSALRHASDHVDGEFDGVKEFYKCILLDRCKDEATLCECCLALVFAPNGVVEVASVLQALQIIFSRNDVEPLALRRALQKLEYIITNGVDIEENYCELIRQVEKLRTRKDLSGKEGRVLRRDIVMFLGKYGNRTDLNNNTASNDLALTKLMDSLTLTIPNPEDGSNYKLSLRSIVQLAIEKEDPSVLQTLLVVICANLPTSPLAPSLRLVLTRVTRALCAAHARGDDVSTRALLPALTLADDTHCLQLVLTYVSEEKSPGVRKMLSDALEELLVKKNDDELVSVVAEHATVMMKSYQPTRKRAGLNITEILMTVLKKNNLLTKELLPNILVQISKTFEIDADVTFDTASRHFIERIELFKTAVVDQIIENLLKVLMSDDSRDQNGEIISVNTGRSIDSSRHVPRGEDRSVAGRKQHNKHTEKKIFKNMTKLILEFVKNIFDYRRDDKTSIVKIFYEVFDKGGVCFDKSVFVMAEMRIVFDFDVESCRKVLLYRKSSILNDFLHMDLDDNDSFRTEVVLKFLEEYSEILLEVQCQNTQEFISETIKKLTPYCIKSLHREIKSCLSKYTKNSVPTYIQKALESWCQRLPLEQINTSLEKEQFLSEHAVALFSLKTMLKTIKMSDLSTLTDVRIVARKWAKILLHLFSRECIQNYLRSKMTYLVDILTVSVMFLTVTDVKKLLLEGSTLQGLPTEKIGVKFCVFFMNVFYDVLVKKPHFLLDEDMRSCSVLINDVVKYTLKKKRSDEEYENVLEMVDEIWPVYSETSSFNQKLSLLSDLTNFPMKLGAGSNPLKWATSAISSNGSSQETAALLVVLPGGTEFSHCYRTFASNLPTRLSEMKSGSHAILRALLDALATTKDAVILDIIMTLSEGDDTKGWWDDAIESCMASIAVHENLDLCKAVFARCQEGISLQICTRVLLPLLRYSSSSFCESFYASILKDLLALKETQPSKHYSYHKAIAGYTRTFILLTLAFEKICPSSLESPSSLLYHNLKPSQSWHLVRSACKICNTLRGKVTLPADAGDHMREDYRLFHCMNYNCLSAAICRRRPDENIYKVLFVTDVFNKMVEQNKDYKLKIVSQWNHRTRRQAVSIELDTRNNSTLTQVTNRSKMFLRTLTECPLAFDLIEDSNTEEVQTQDLELVENELNHHESAGTLTALLCHLTSLPHEQWRTLLVTCVRDAERNTRWFLAQMICNCKEELKPQASILRPALLEVVSSTPVEVNGKKVLNGLHMNIIETLILWGDQDPIPSEHLNTTIELLVTTCLEYRQYDSLYKTVLGVLNKFLEIYASVIEVDFKIFEDGLKDSNSSKTIQLLQCLSKSKVLMEKVVSTCLDMLEAKQKSLIDLAKLFGLALANCEDKQRHLARFKKVLQSYVNKSSGDLIKILFYSQNGCAACCDEYYFRHIVHLTANIVGPDQAKCLSILSTFVSNSTSQRTIQDLYETLDLSELISSQTVEVLKLIKVGVRSMSDAARRRLVILASGFSTNVVGKVRREAFEVMLQAFEDILTTSTETPSAKMPRTNRSSIVKYIKDNNDYYVSTVLRTLSNGLLDRDGDIADLVRQSLAGHLSKDMTVRFIESFLLCVYLPVTSNNKTDDPSVCLSALLDLLFHQLKTHERFKKLKLRDEPLEFNIPNQGPSKLLTMSRTYQGTFGGRTNLTGRRKATLMQDSEMNKQPVDVQISMETILDSLLHFAKQTPEAAQELCVNFARTLSGFGSEPAAIECLSTILSSEPNGLTPFAIEMTRVLVSDVCKTTGILDTLKALREKTLNTEGEKLTKSIYNDMKILSLDNEQFILGAQREIADDEDDVNMDEDLEFSLRDLTSAFGKLGNWEVLTVRERRKICDSGLPALWTDRDTFREQLDNFTPSAGWFTRMVSAYRGEEAECTVRWLRQVDNWPQRHFQVEATTEAIQWLTHRDEVPKSLCDIQANDCLAEWAARLMLREAYMHSISDEPEQTDVMLSRSHQLKWCERANEMELHAPVLQCVKRNISDLYKCETLPWLYQKLVVLRNKELRKHGDDINSTEGSESLRKLLVTAETYTPEFAEHSKDTDVIAMNKLMFLLRTDLKDRTIDVVPRTLKSLDECLENRRYDVQNKESLHTFYKVAITYLDNVFDDPKSDTTEACTLLMDVLNRLENVNIHDYGIACYALRQLQRWNTNEEGFLEENAVRKLMEQLQRHYLNDFVIDYLDQFKNRIPQRLFEEFPLLDKRRDDVRNKYKQCLQLVCDPEYSLLQYCEEIYKCFKKNDPLRDKAKLMQAKLFENRYAGTDYQLLNRYKIRLDELQLDLDNPTDYSEEQRMKIETTLREIILELDRKPPQSVLRLSQLCPTLSKCETCPGDLLGLPDNVTVVRFHEQVPVYTDSIRRPAVLSALLSNGHTKRFLHKSGESLANDASAQITIKYASQLWTRVNCPIVGYNVTLLCEDSGLIEYLDDYERLRDMIAETCDLDAPLRSVNRPPDTELLKAPIEANLSQLRQMCRSIPSHALRDAIFKRSVIMNDFLKKTARFQDTTCSSTVLCWILGVGDRHLQNILCSTQDGGVCHVDFGAMTKFQANELAPARLTRNILAVCDTQELIARIQQLMIVLRDSRLLFNSVAGIFPGDQSHIARVLQGELFTIKQPSLPEDMTDLELFTYKELISYNTDRQTDRHVLHYDVEQQVQWLLNKCTDTRILASTRSGWEPWI